VSDDQIELETTAGDVKGRSRRSQHVIEGACRAWKNNCTVKQ